MPDHFIRQQILHSAVNNHFFQGILAENRRVRAGLCILLPGMALVVVVHGTVFSLPAFATIGASAYSAGNPPGQIKVHG